MAEEEGEEGGRGEGVEEVGAFRGRKMGGVGGEVQESEGRWWRPRWCWQVEQSMGTKGEGEKVGQWSGHSSLPTPPAQASTGSARGFIGGEVGQRMRVEEPRREEKRPVIGVVTGAENAGGWKWVGAWS